MLVKLMSGTFNLYVYVTSRHGYSRQNFMLLLSLCKNIASVSYLLFVYVVVNFSSHVIFIFLLFRLH